MAVCLFQTPFQVFSWASKGLLAVSLIGTLSLAAVAQEPPSAEETEVEAPAEAPVEIRRIDQNDTNTFSINAADQLAAEASQAIAAQQFSVAIDKLVEARRIYNDLSTLYQELSAMFVGVDTRQNQENRQKALETAQKRDEVSYQLALLYRTQNRPEAAIPILMDILRSQQPTRDLGQQAYQQLYEIGFVENPYER